MFAGLPQPSEASMDWLSVDQGCTAYVDTYKATATGMLTQASLVAQVCDNRSTSTESHVDLACCFSSPAPRGWSTCHAQTSLLDRYNPRDPVLLHSLIEIFIYKTLLPLIGNGKFEANSSFRELRPTFMHEQIHKFNDSARPCRRAISLIDPSVPSHSETMPTQPSRRFANA